MFIIETFHFSILKPYDKVQSMYPFIITKF